MNTLLDLLASTPLNLDEYTTHARCNTFHCKFPMAIHHGFHELLDYTYLANARDDAHWAGIWFTYQDERYLALSFPGWKMAVFSSNTTIPTEVQWWTYQLQRVHCTLAQDTFFRGNAKKGYNLHYLIKDLAFVDDWIWDASQLLTYSHLDSEVRQFTQQLRPLFNAAQNQDEKDALRDSMLETLLVLDVPQYDEESLRGVIQSTIQQAQWSDREELSIYLA